MKRNRKKLKARARAWRLKKDAELTDWEREFIFGERGKKVVGILSGTVDTRKRRS